MTSSDVADPWLPDADDLEFADDGLVCERCGTPLIDDPDDDPSGAPDALPLCGECDRNRNMEADLAWLDGQDGQLDGMIDW